MQQAVSTDLKSKKFTINLIHRVISPLNFLHSDLEVKDKKPKDLDMGDDSVIHAYNNDFAIDYDTLLSNLYVLTNHMKYLNQKVFYKKLNDTLQSLLKLQKIPSVMARESAQPTLFSILNYLKQELHHETYSLKYNK